MFQPCLAHVMEYVTYVGFRVFFLSTDTEGGVLMHAGHHLPKGVGHHREFRLTTAGVGVITDHVISLTRRVAGQNLRQTNGIMTSLCLKKK